MSAAQMAEVNVRDACYLIHLCLKVNAAFHTVILLDHHQSENIEILFKFKFPRIMSRILS